MDIEKGLGAGRVVVSGLHPGGQAERLLGGTEKGEGAPSFALVCMYDKSRMIVLVLGDVHVSAVSISKIVPNCVRSRFTVSRVHPPR